MPRRTRGEQREVSCREDVVLDRGRALIGLLAEIGRGRTSDTSLTSVWSLPCSSPCSRRQSRALGLPLKTVVKRIRTSL